MRLFTGIPIAPHVVDELGCALAVLQPIAAIQWSPPENLHITTKFIGEWPESQLPELEQALGGVEPRQKIQISIAGFGFFPNPNHPRVLFAGVHAGSELGDLARGIDAAMARLGCAREDRPYTPHLTLARIRNPNEDIRRLREHIASMTDFDFGKFDATGFQLYLSKPGPAGSVYSTLSAYPFMKETPATL